MNNVAINVELLDAAVKKLQPDVLMPARIAALAEFAKNGLPGGRDEDWKYTNLAPVAELSNEWLDGDTAAGSGPIIPGAQEDRVRQSVDAHWITLSDGRIRVDESLAALESAGLSIALLSHGGDTRVTYAGDALSSLNAALLRDGLHITIDKNALLDRPIGLLISDPPHSVAQERIIVDVGSEASIQLIECHLSDRGDERFTNAVIQVTLAQGATLDHVRLQNSHQSHLLVGKTTADLQDGAMYRYATFDFGGRLVRNDMVVEINGSAAQAVLHGLYLAGNTQHIDNHILVNHRVGPAISIESYRGILNGSARCVFNGKAVVYRGADGTDARQSNHNLLLSDRAEIDTKPELEIYADDVKCSHGATVGQLDQAALFYLRSRGISKNDAAKILTRAFAAGTVGESPIENCREFIGQLLDAKLAEMDIC